MTTRSVILAALFAALIALAALMSRQPACEAGGPAKAGDVKHDGNGKLLYFDGRCWTSKPTPPRDAPF
jgi:hypothetical protein